MVGKMVKHSMLILTKNWATMAAGCWCCQNERIRPSCLWFIIRGCSLPSKVDNLPNTCLEAMALKRVVIGSRTAASFDQLISDGVNGFPGFADRRS